MTKRNLVGAGLVLALTLIVVSACCSGNDTVAQEASRSPRITITETAVNGFAEPAYFILHDNKTGYDYLVVQRNGIAVTKMEK